MEGLDRITDHILKDSQAEADALLAHALEDARLKRIHYGNAADERYRQLLASGDVQAEALIRQSLSAAQLAAGKMLLSVKQELVSAVFSEALGRLNTLPPEDYLAFLVRQAVKGAITGSEEIMLNAADRETYGTDLVVEANHLLEESGILGELVLSGDIHSASGGLILRSGLIETNCTWESLIKRARNTLICETAKFLFNEGERDDGH